MWIRNEEYWDAYFNLIERIYTELPQNGIQFAYPHLERIIRTQMLANLFKSIIGKEPEAIIPISGSGSNRRYYRLQCSPNISYIGVEGTSVEENKAFLYMADHFMKLGLPVPKVVAQSKDFRYYLQQDLGDTSLFDIIKQSTEVS